MDTQQINIPEADNQLAVINNSIEVFKSAPEVLRANQERTEKAKATGEKILAQWQAAWAIRDEDERLKTLQEADARSNNFLANCAAALKQQKELRAAITQMMDWFRKLFTAAENEIDKGKEGSIAQRVQANRDSCAAETAKVAERRRREAERKAAKEKEAIDITAFVQVECNANFNEFLLQQKQKLMSAFNALTPDDFDVNAAKIIGYQPAYKTEHFSSLPYKTPAAKLHDMNELFTLVQEAKQPHLQIFSERYVAEMTELRDELRDKLPSKFAELQEQKRLADEAAAAAEAARAAEAKRQAEIAKANAAEKIRLEAEAAKAREAEAIREAELKKRQEAAEAERLRREAEEAARLAAETEAANAKAEQQAELKKQEEATMLLFNKEAELAEVMPAGEARAGYEITVTHPAGYVQIFQFWFENEGRNLPVEKIGNTKLDQMKAFCEKQALKTGEKIDSKFIVYTDTFKAVNRKK